MCNKTWILSSSVGKHLLKLIYNVLSFFGHLNSDSILIKLLFQAGRDSVYIGYDCLYVSHVLAHICIALRLRFQQNLYAKHDFRALKNKSVGGYASFQGIPWQTQTPLVTFFCNFTGIFPQKCRRRFTSSSRFKFKLNRRTLFKNGIHQ
jgi:hypothetical protein